MAKTAYSPTKIASAKPFPNPTVLKVQHGICFDVKANANKFYRTYLEESSNGQYRCRTHYGRVGYEGQIEVRAQGTSKYEAEDAYECQLREKYEPRGKYRIVPVVEEKASAPVATRDLGGRSVAVVATNGVKMIGSGGTQRGGRGVRAPSAWVRSAQDFYNALLNEATVLVETGMQATSLSAAGFMTPLGLIDDDELAKAQGILKDFRAELASRRSNQYRIETLNNDFYRIIPTAMGMKVSSSLITSLSDVDREENVIDTARGLIAAQAGVAAGSDTKANEYPVLLEEVSPEEIAELTALLRKETCSCHGSEIRTLGPKRAFRVTREKEKAAFVKRAKELGLNTVQTLFHGTRRTSAAGILSRGLLPSSAAASSGGSVSGAAFGEGIYFASNAGKSLGYTGGAGKGKRIMFVAMVAMGKPHVHTGWNHGRSSVRTSTTHSVWAKSGSGLAHDEMIVPRPDQTALGYVMEV